MHPADLGGHVLKELVDRNDVPGDDYEDVIFGSVDTIGPLAGDIARTCWLSAGLPLHVPGVTIDRQCGSSQQSVHFAAQAVMSGTADVVVAGGVQAMSQIPISAAMLAGQAYGFGDPFTGSIGWVKRFGDGLVTQFNSAEMIAEKWGLSRQDLEQFALNSNERAFRAIDEGRFDR
jgi:acetyl-CoA C-acetyltransferase